MHVLGDISQDYDAQSVTGHFVGAGVSRGPPCTKDCNEVGMIGGDAKITADGSGRSTGQLLDEFIRLNGVNSIVGRSIVIHGIEGNTGARAAWCVVGLDTQTTELVSSVVEYFVQAGNWEGLTQAFLLQFLISNHHSTG